MSSAYVAMPQASLEPSSTCAVVMLAEPVPSSCTVMFLVVTVGFVLSVTVTVKLSCTELPLTSVAVYVTTVEPTGKVAPES